MSAPATVAPPPQRARAFADGVRRRVAPRGVRRPLRAWRAGEGRMPQLDRVLRLAVRPFVLHEHRHTAGPTTVDLHFAFPLRGEGTRRREESGRTPAATTGRPSAVPSVGNTFARTRAEAPSRVPAIGRAAVRPLPTKAPPMTVAASRPPSLDRAPLVLRAHAKDAASRPAPSAVPLVHRSTATVPSASHTEAAAVSSPLAVRWSGTPSSSPAVQPLTSADIPVVVDRVVGEIDRRLTAARERRGWTA